ncbi:DUF4124 domain-containing protein [Guyparkeria halophila]|uniref:DUF4124 domain-containing protein n=1 Tax=Guyparkeria halophila TaxID=47960 RepID=A0A6I6CW83_9GAMM|nr:DUF4124 domain-containing protein [Guyparkeria halophila]QGT77560.1 DUF4124 domain-containing protein [Guyparkeria halophila]
MRETMHKRRLAVTFGAIAALVASVPSVGQEGETVYKCIHSDGRIVYSDQPCTGSATGGMDGQMEVQTITAPPPGSGGEAAREGIKRIAEEYDQRQEAERKAREEADRRALERRLSNPEVVVVAPWRDEPRYIPYYPQGKHLLPYDRYRDPAHGGMRLDDNGFSLWYDSGYPFPHHRPPPPHRPPHDDRPPRDPYSSDGRPIKEPGYSGRYPGGFPGLR